MTATIELRDIEVTRNRTTILSDLNWNIRDGENWVVFGPNGAGKTTLLNLLTGYIWPTSGTVTVLGDTLGEIQLCELRRHVSLVSEPIRQMINDGLNGLEVLITGGRGHLNLFEPATDAEIERADREAADLQLKPLLRKPFGVMSTGERQRLMIARALMCNPRLVILDEPCAGLDLAGREFVLDTIEAVCAREDRPSLVLTTHHVEEITPCFSHMMLLKEGRQFVAGTIPEALTSANLTHLFGRCVEVVKMNGRYHASVAH